MNPHCLPIWEVVGTLQNNKLTCSLESINIAPHALGHVSPFPRFRAESVFRAHLCHDLLLSQGQTPTGKGRDGPGPGKELTLALQGIIISQT